MTAKRKTANEPKRYKLADVIRDVEESRHKIVIEADNGEEFFLDPPELWDDDIYTESAGGPVEEAKSILGEDEYKRFRAAGGSAGLLQAILQDHLGATPLGES